MSLVQLKNLSVLYGTPPLLDGIEFVLHSKERVCIVGRNGSGKSTLMRVIANEIAYGSVALVNAKVEVLATPPGIFATQ